MAGSCIPTRWLQDPSLKVSSGVISEEDKP